MADFNAHELTLEFRRFLSEDEWRDVVSKARELPYVKNLRANAVLIDCEHKFQMQRGDTEWTCSVCGLKKGFSERDEYAENVTQP